MHAAHTRARAHTQFATKCLNVPSRVRVQDAKIKDLFFKWVLRLSLYGLCVRRAVLCSALPVSSALLFLLCCTLCAGWLVSIDTGWKQMPHRCVGGGALPSISTADGDTAAVSKVNFNDKFTECSRLRMACRLCVCNPDVHATVTGTPIRRGTRQHVELCLFKCASHLIIRIRSLPRFLCYTRDKAENSIGAKKKEQFQLCIHKRSGSTEYELSANQTTLAKQERKNRMRPALILTLTRRRLIFFAGDIAMRSARRHRPKRIFEWEREREMRHIQTYLF